MLSGPNDLEAFACLMAFLVLSEEKLGSPLLERDFFLRVRIRAVLDDECLTMEVNCLLNLVAIFLASETILPLKVMDWLDGAGWPLLSDLTVFHSFGKPTWRLKVARCSSHLVHLCSSTIRYMSAMSSVIQGDCGSEALSKSRSAASSTAKQEETWLDFRNSA